MLPFLEIISDVDVRNRVEELYYRHRQLLFTIAKSHLHNDDLAEEAIQETFLAVAETCETLDLSDDKAAMDLLTVIASRRSKRMYNKGKRNEELITKISLHESYEEYSPEDDFLNKYELETVLKAVKSLDEKYREPLQLQVRHKLKTKEIAILLGISDGSVRQLLHTARVKIRKMVEKEVKINE